MININLEENKLCITRASFSGLSYNKEYYQFSSIKSLSWIKDSNDDYFVIINFIANDKNNSLRIKIKDVSNFSWANNEAGAYQALSFIANWMNPTSWTGVMRTPEIITTSTSGSTFQGAYSVSIANVGAAAGTVNGQTLPAGVTINFDAGAINHVINELNYDATGTTFLITWIV